MNGAQLFLRTLKDHGIGVVFGIIGREAQVLCFDETATVRFILTRDERAAALMADVQGRLTGKVGVCYSTFGPGATNMMTGIASAYADRSPVLAISAQIEAGKIHSSAHQYVDQVAMARPITKYAAEITDIARLVPEIAKAIHIAQAGMPGPSFLSISLDVFTQNISRYKAPACPPASLPADRRMPFRKNVRGQQQAARTLLAESARPIAVVGGAIRDAAVIHGVREFIITQDIPVVTTYGGKGLFTVDDEQYLGTVSKYLDHFCPGVRRTIFKTTDLVLLIGADMTEGTEAELWEEGGPKKICSIDSLIAEQQSGIKVAACLPARKLARGFKGERRRYWSKKELRGLRQRVSQMRERTLCKRQEQLPFDVVRTLNELMDPEDILVCDVGIHKQIVSLFYEATAEKRFFCSNGLGAMGFGLPAALGAKQAHPEKKVVAVCGDGGFHISSQDLETSIRCKLPVICIVICDGTVGLIRHYQRKGFNRTNSAVTDFGRVDLAGLARASGCRGYRATGRDSMYAALKRALRSNTTTIIEIPVDRDRYVDGA